MLKSSLPIKLATIALTSVLGLIPLNSAKAGIFDEVEVDQENFIAVAQPFGEEDRLNLIVVEQIPGMNTCWSEFGSNPINVDLLLINFDFSGHCRRATDANGYSIRYEGEDLGLDYILSLVRRQGQLHLVGINIRENKRINVGTVGEYNDQAMKINLNPGWKFTRRTYQGNPLGHVYFSYTAPQEEIMEQNNNMNEPDEMNQTPTEGQIRDIIAPTQDNQSMSNPTTQPQAQINSRHRYSMQSRFSR
ncbi:DUF3747 domain-containing protein [Cyanobacterium stanieri LEGE 03274]|uniref:DUF3747 domain-containing protein n=1 Tax=Cyanobacterium stanieri LEGE 03274 TaxID=1828756 RepID=A0ABR9V8E9_9CHRO|nr:DUF3747 domain-containing protein [Cyanobacterium stanieri]MBE9223801.1 DUF3747 domain-containing protein [Cyanobacterium stanieri LEGE 03274]